MEPAAQSKEKKMDVIMLTGPNSCGKTTVLNLLYDDLTVNYGATVHTAKNQLGGNPNDFESVLIYKGKKVAIFTMGDYSNDVVAAMNKYAATADVLIIACNSKFKNPFIAITVYGHHIIQKSKQAPANRNSNDVVVVSQIIPLI
jgi:ABC-type cobalamin/Fe3+-siderophores transport system ATPase subunit